MKHTDARSIRLSYRVPYLLIVLIGLSTVAGCLPLYMDSAIEQLRQTQNPPLVRVRVVAEADAFTLKTAGRFTVLGGRANGEWAVYSLSDKVIVRLRNKRFRVVDRENVSLDSDLVGVWVQPADQSAKVRLNGNPYYGEMIFGTDRRGTTEIVNRLNLDRYLMGVLTPELGERTDDEFESVKAQAVAARTYALAHLGQYPNALYDLSADVSDQIYVGASQQRDWVDRAVKATRGEVLTYNGHLIEAYYHSTCGGKTDAIEDIWNQPPEPYLVAVDDDTLCNWSKYWHWTERFDSTTLVDNLRSYLKPNPSDPFRITDIKVCDTTPGGRNRHMTVYTQQREWTVKDDQIRWALGRPSRPGSILPSGRFTMELTRAADGHVIGAVINGGGYGHGVGLCQCGMIGRARAGEEHKAILEFYYPGAQVQHRY
jgi:stage II sporulation protein D